MIRSSRFTPVLSKICSSTLGIYASLVMTADGDVLGQYTEPMTPTTGHSKGTPISGESVPTSSFPPMVLDLSCIGALVIEFSSDYSKLAKDMENLDATYASTNITSSPPTTTTSITTNDGFPSSVNTNISNPLSSSSSRGMQCLMVDMDQGVIGISKAVGDIYVIAIANTSVDRALFKSRLMKLVNHIEPFLLLYQSCNGSFCPP